MSSQGDSFNLLKAANFAAVKHRNQRRKDASGTPYINHPINVAWILANEGGVEDPKTLQAALLHDTVEDTETTFEELEEEFGPEVTSIVREVSDDKSLPKAERKRLQIQHAKESSHPAKLVKLADKLSNLRDLMKNPPSKWSKERIQGYFVWSYHVVESLRGTNEKLEEKLDKIFEGSFEFEGVEIPTLPQGDLKTALEVYYWFL